MKKEMTISDFFSFVKSKLKIIIIVAVVAAIVAFLMVRAFAKSSYTYDGSLMITTSLDGIEDYSITQVGQAVAIAKGYVPTYVSVLQSKSFYELVRRDVNPSLSASAIKSMVRYSVDSDTLMISFVVTSGDQVTAKKIAQSITKLAPEYAKSVVSSCKIAVIDSPKDASVSRTSPLFAAFSAFFAAAIIVLLIAYVTDMLDSRIKNEVDLSEKYNVPVIGIIPIFSAVAKDAQKS